jgi:hypothetical protein
MLQETFYRIHPHTAPRPTRQGRGFRDIDGHDRQAGHDLRLFNTFQRGPVAILGTSHRTQTPRLHYHGRLLFTAEASVVGLRDEVIAKTFYRGHAEVGHWYTRRRYGHRSYA